MKEGRILAFQAPRRVLPFKSFQRPFIISRNGFNQYPTHNRVTAGNTKSLLSPSSSPRFISFPWIFAGRLSDWLKASSHSHYVWQFDAFWLPLLALFLMLAMVYLWTKRPWKTMLVLHSARFMNKCAIKGSLKIRYSWGVAQWKAKNKLCVYRCHINGGVGVVNR